MNEKGKKNTKVKTSNVDQGVVNPLFADLLAEEKGVIKGQGTENR